MPFSCPLSRMTPSLEELETDLTTSPLSRHPEPRKGWTGRCPGICSFPYLWLGSSLSHSFQASSSSMVPQVTILSLGDKRNQRGGLGEGRLEGFKSRVGSLLAGWFFKSKALPNTSGEPTQKGGFEMTDTCQAISFCDWGSGFPGIGLSI